MKRNWRWLAFAIVIVATSLLGLYLHHYPIDNAAKADLADPPLHVGVYVDNPEIRVSVRIEVYRAPTHEVHAELFLRQDRPGTVLFTTDLRPNEETPRPRIIGSRLWAVVFEDTKGYKQLDNDPRGGVVATFTLPDSSFPDTPDGVHTRLPAIAFSETGVQYDAPVVQADDGYHDDAAVRGVPNTVLVRKDPTKYHVPSRSTIFRLFWEPKKLSTAEALDGMGQVVPTSHIDVNLPSNGSIHGNDIVWTGTFGLSATFSADGANYQSRRLRNDFLSGIFFAIATATVIALIQELPDRLSWQETRYSARAWALLMALIIISAASRLLRSRYKP